MTDEWTIRKALERCRSERWCRLDGDRETSRLVTRVRFYLRRGHDLDRSAWYAWAWWDNVTEQHDRRLSHDTGAAGWL